MFVTLKKVLTKAQKNNYAVGAFNINNLEFVQAIIAAAERMKSPIILSTSEGAIKYAGIDYLYALAEVAEKNTSIPVVLHLDHGRDMSVIKKCLSKGYSSVMYDGSHLPLKKNILNTKKVVSWAHKRSVSVEGELGTIGGAEDVVSARKIILTEPLDAKEFVEKTGVDALAIAIGTSHGAYKFSGKSKLDIPRLKKIRKVTKIPLVLHGASSVPFKLVRIINRFGGKIRNARGVSEDQIRKAVRHGIAKVNEDTDLRLAFIDGMRVKLKNRPEIFDPRKILGKGRDEVQKIVEHRMTVLGSRGKA